MSDNLTYDPVPVPGVLEGAAQCQEVLVLGLDKDGLLYMASSVSDKTILLWWVEQFRHKLLAGDFDG